MISNPFNNSTCTAITNAKTLSSMTSKINLSTSRTIKTNVTNDYIVFSFKTRFSRRIDDDIPSRQTFANIIIGISFQLNTNAFSQKSTKTLTGRTIKFYLQGVLR